jgi:uncharacterized protein YgbK (DUF1537 family)
MPLLGCIADDYTGGTDLANNLAKTGFRTIQVLGLPKANIDLASVDAIVIALKSRTAPVNLAVEQSAAALSYLIRAGCQQFYFKYCSTFDSTAKGNIGPVIDFLLFRLGEDFTVVCPAFPDTGRTIYRGHLFVNDALLNESGMQHHPITPMRDANIVRVLSSQTASRVCLLRFDQVKAGAEVLRKQLTKLRSEGCRMAVVDILENRDLDLLAQAVKELRLLTGGSGLASFLGQNFSRTHPVAIPIQSSPGSQAILAGSCSRATLQQLSKVETIYPCWNLAVDELMTDFSGTLRLALLWTERHLSEGQPIVLYTSAPAEDMRAAQETFGVEQTGATCEAALADIGRELVNRGVTQMVVAGGETSGAVLNALGVAMLEIGPEIVAGVPWTSAQIGKKRVALALKSGNFGGDDFFVRAWQVLG